MQPRAQQRLQHFQHDQRDEACTERQGEVVGVEGTKGKELGSQMATAW